MSTSVPTPSDASGDAVAAAVPQEPQEPRVYPFVQTLRNNIDAYHNKVRSELVDTIVESITFASNCGERKVQFSTKKVHTRSRVSPQGRSFEDYVDFSKVDDAVIATVQDLGLMITKHSFGHEEPVYVVSFA